MVTIPWCFETIGNITVHVAQALHFRQDGEKKKKKNIAWKVVFSVWCCDDVVMMLCDVFTLKEVMCYLNNFKWLQSGDKIRRGGRRLQNSMPYPPLSYVLQLFFNKKLYRCFFNHFPSLATRKLRPPCLPVSDSAQTQNEASHMGSDVFCSYKNKQKYWSRSVVSYFFCSFILTHVITVQLLVSMVGGLEGVWVPWCFHNQVKYSPFPSHPCKLDSRYCQVQVFKQYGAASQCSSTVL